jgi:hypothetical protein
MTDYRSLGFGTMGNYIPFYDATTVIAASTSLDTEITEINLNVEQTEINLEGETCCD